MNIYNYKVIKLPMKKFLLRLFMSIGYGVISYFIVFICNNLFIKNIDIVLFRFFLEGIIFVIIYVLFVIVFEGKFVLACVKKRNY